MSTLVIYSGDNLQNSKYTVTSETARSATSTDVQSIPVARGTGSTVVNSRLEAKVFSLTGSLHTTPGKNLQRVIADFDAIFNKGNKRLRFIPEYEFIADAQETSGWETQGGGSNVTIDEDNFNFLAASLKFDYADANAWAELYNSTLPAVDISGYENPNFEFTLNIPNVDKVNNIEVRVGNDSLNYYGARLDTQIFNEDFVNGRNMFSVPKSATTETGSVTDTAIDYVYIRINANTQQSAMSVNFDGLYIAEEDRIRNYRVYKNGGTERDDGHFWIDSITYSGLTFLCPDGYGTSTHAVEMFNLTGQTTNPNNNIITLDGSTNLLPEYLLTINSQTNLQKVTISNETVGQSLTFDRTWANGDVFTFGGLDVVSRVNTSVLEFDGQIPDHPPGLNNIRLSFALSTAVTQSWLTYNANRNYDGATTADKGYLAQSFTANETGTITDLKLHIPQRTPDGGFTAGWVVADSGGNPASFNTTDPDFFIPESSGSAFATADLRNNVAVTNTNKYWIILPTYFLLGPGETSYRIYWSYNTAGGASGEAKGNDGTGWSSLSGDQVYEVTITPSVSINYDWKGTYYKLYV